MAICIAGVAHSQEDCPSVGVAKDDFLAKSFEEAGCKEQHLEHHCIYVLGGNPGWGFAILERGTIYTGGDRSGDNPALALCEAKVQELWANGAGFVAGCANGGTLTSGYQVFWYTRTDVYNENRCLTGSWNGSSCEIECAQATPPVTSPRKASSPAGPCPLVGNPIDYKYGIKVESHTDYQGGGDFPLTVRRNYSSDRLSENLDDNPHWRFTYTGSNVRQLTFPTGDPNAEVLVYNSDRSTIRFVSFDGGTNYISDSDITTRLQRLGIGWQVTDNGDRVEEFDEQGRVIAIRQREGLTHTYQYNSDSVTITDSFGRSLIVDLNTRGYPSRITLPDSTSIGYTYDDTGILTTVTFEDQTQINYLYEDVQGLLTGVVDERGIRYSTFGYDENGKANLTEHVGGLDSYSFSYDELRSIVTNPLGKVTNHVFEEIQGAPKLKTSGRLDSPYCGPASSSYDYDTNGFVSSKIDWEGNVTTYLKDSRGLPATTTYAQGTTEERVVNTQWHSDFRLPEVITEPGRTTTYTYSPYNNPNYTQRTVADITTGETRTWTYSYNNLGQILSIDGPRVDVTDAVSYTYFDCATGGQCGQVYTLTNGLGQVTTYDNYDLHGYPLQMTDVNGVVTTMVYDQRQRLTSITVDGRTTTITYEPTGDVKRTTLPDGTYTEYVRDDGRRLVAVFDGEGNRIDWTLDNAGNRTDEKISDPNGAIRKSLHSDFDELSRIRQMVYAHGGVTGYEYDNNGNPTKLTDANNRVSTSEYDALDRLIKEIDAISGETTYGYDDRDNLTSVTDPEGLTTTYVYNGFDEVVSETSPDTGTTIYTYDEAGNLATETDARGITATYSYDALNRLTDIIYPDSSENISYVYDQGANAVGRVSRIDDASGSTDYGYDARGNIVSVTQTVNGQSYTQGYSYNGANRLTGMTYPSGRSISYGRDDSGRVSQIDSTGGDEGVETLANGINRLPFGPIETLTLGNGIPRTRTYDQDYRVTNLTDGNVLIKGLGYSSVNNITAISDNVDSDLTQLFVYDDLDRLEFATGNYGEDTYSYDAIGNRLSFARDGQSDSYLYGGSSHRLQSVAGQGYQYDDAGNTLSDGARSYAYNDRNRLAQATANGVSTEYDHNALGQRVIKSGEDGETHYVYDLEGRLIAEAQDGYIVVEYAYLDGEPLVMWREENQLPTVPPEPTLLSPLEAVATANPTYTWEEDTTAIEYQLYVFDRSVPEWVSNEKYAATSICSEGNCSVTMTQPLGGYSRNHAWKVRARNTAGWGPTNPNEFFDYLPEIPGVVTLVSPLETVATANPSYTWKADTTAIEYQLYLYDRSVPAWVSKEKYTADSVCSTGTCSVTPTEPLGGYSRNHAWKVRARNTAGWGPANPNEFFDYLPEIPGVVTLVSPLETVATANPSYTWEANTTAIEYQLYLYDRSVPAWVSKEKYTADSVCSTGTCSVTPTEPLGGYSRNHAWKVRARNTAGWGPTNPNEYFDYLPGLPEQVTLVSPLDAVSTSNPTYSWQADTTANEYQLFLFDRSVPAWVSREKFTAESVCTAGVCSVTPSQPLGGYSKNHAWKVRARNAAGWGPLNPNEFFDYLPPLPEQVVLLSPLTTVDTASPAFTWADAGDSTDYQIRIYDRSVPGWVYNSVYTESSICSSGSCSVTPSVTLGENGNHLWRVRGKNQSGWGEWVPNQSFGYTASTASAVVE